MAKNRSKKAARFGAFAERAAFGRYGLEPDRDSWHDARDRDGRPWDVKACMLSRDSARFRLWADQHSRLRSEGGGYVFVGYLPRGSGIQVKQMRTVRAASITAEFYTAGNHAKGDQLKIPPRAVFVR
ncbi:ORF9 [Halogeometricum pleomorphic virus 1]|uniref:ORF9 n=1 Tax=Halogeometricum pleomorphic virus 1 TaxID=1156722 RepID=H9ABR0_9VIRU|nr:ORF9 [Halogeometricum pleomorphic virus 1]AFD04030.1 ORF9 [Halogeometricum pleomorphic virus 1]